MPFDLGDDAARFRPTSGLIGETGSGANDKGQAYLVSNARLKDPAGMLSVDELFKGRHFDREIIVLCVCWYLRVKLGFLDLVEMMAEAS